MISNSNETIEAMVKKRPALNLEEKIAEQLPAWRRRVDHLLKN